MINFAKIWDILITKFPAFMEGVEITLQLAFFTVLFGSLLGLSLIHIWESSFAP